MRRSLEIAVLLVIASLVVRTWYVQGLVVPLLVTTGSMAETLLGLHRDVVCQECGYGFSCGADARPVAVWAVCPNCGCGWNDLESQPDVAGDRVLVDKSIFRFRSPRRWEVVAFRHPEQASQSCVKRVVGLPGESIQIREGDVYADGLIQRKPLSLERAMAVLVYDAGYRPESLAALPSRWRSDDSAGAWQWSDGSFTHPAAASPQAIDWLTYHHQRRLPGRAGEVVETPIMDVCGYNQSQPRRIEDIHPVTDLLLSFRLVRATGPGRLWIRAGNGREEFRVWIEPGELRYGVSRNALGDQPLANGTLTASPEGLRVEVSLFDQQFVLALGGKEICQCAYEPGDGPLRPTTRPFALGSEGPETEICDLRVYRDVYYTHPLGPSGRWAAECPVRLPEDEYFVLGDNSPISEDSRGWSEGPGVPAKLLIGKPLVVHWPARRLDVGPWHFQVPDPAKIRYIR